MVSPMNAADGPEPFSFVYFGDAQNDLEIDGRARESAKP